MFTVYDFCFFKRKTAYELRISDWSSDVCSSDLSSPGWPSQAWLSPCGSEPHATASVVGTWTVQRVAGTDSRTRGTQQPAYAASCCRTDPRGCRRSRPEADMVRLPPDPRAAQGLNKTGRSEEHTSELQSLMRISYAVFCWKKKKNKEQPP